jgi:phosphoribosylformylglycinamidine cyclo-ligase
MAHITGGGLVENVPRVLPDAVTAVLEKSAWPRPPLFDWLQKEGNVAEHEMHRVFNCGIGMAVVVAAEHADAALKHLKDAGETAYRIGAIRARKEGEAQTLVV